MSAPLSLRPPTLTESPDQYKQYQELWARMEPKLKRALQNHHPNYRDDLLTEAMMGCWHAVLTHDPSKKSLSSYAYDCVRIAQLRWLRSRQFLIKIPVWLYETGHRPQSPLSLDLMPDDDDNPLPEPMTEVDWDVIPLHSELRAAFRALPKDVALPLYLHSVGGQTVMGTARALGIPASTARQRISRGIDLLRAALRRHYIETDLWEDPND